MGYLDYAGLQYLWGKLKEKFAPKSHSHDDRYYTESEMDGKLNSKVDNTESGVNGLLSKLTTSWTATPTDNTYFIRQDTGGGNSFGRVKFSTIWSYIKGKADGVYQPKGSYAASGHTHDDRYYTEAEVNTKLGTKASSDHTHGLNSSSLAKTVDNATTNSWDMVGGNKSFLLRSLRMQSKAPDWLEGNYAAGIAFGGSDTKGVISHAYSSPAIKFAGGNGAAPVWWLRLTGTSGKTYDLNAMPPASHTHSFSSITDKPSTYTPSAHNQSWSTITDKPALMESGDYSAETIEALLKRVQGLSPRMGSCYFTKDTHVANTWWNFIYTPHRTGSGGDNHEYGTLLLFPMVGAGSSYIVRVGKDGIVREVRKIYTSGDKPTKVDVGLGNVDNTADANKSVKYATSAGNASKVNNHTVGIDVPSNAKFTDTNTWRPVVNNLTSDSTDQSLSAAQGKALKTLVDGKAAAGHTHNSVKDAGNNSSNTTFAYSKSGMNYGDYNWLAGWNGYELRAINKNQFATAGHTHDYLPTAGGTMNGDITFSDSSHGKIYSGPTDNVNGPGGDLNNIVIESWNGLSFTTGCPNQTYTGKTAVGIDCREGVVKAARFDGKLNGTAARLGRGGDPNAPMTFNWSGKDGQPTWLWGGEDGTNMYVYNPSNFSVNWANGANNGVISYGFDSNSKYGYIRFINGVQICWGSTNCSGKDTTIYFSAAFSGSSYSVSTMPFYSNLSDTYWNVKEGSMGTTSFVLHGSKSSIDLRTMLWIAIGKWN